MKMKGLLPACCKRHDSVIPPHGTLSPMFQKPQTEMQEERRPGLHTEDGTLFNRKAVTMQERLDLLRLIATPMTGEIVKAGPHPGMQRR